LELSLVKKIKGYQDLYWLQGLITLVPAGLFKSETKKKDWSTTVKLE
jgi:hypothetical protein